jgi:hypothetical protein
VVEVLYDQDSVARHLVDLAEVVPFDVLVVAVVAVVCCAAVRFRGVGFRGVELLRYPLDLLV